MDTADKLSRWAANNHKDISFIGVPKTIDNDLPLLITLRDMAAQPAMLLPPSVRCVPRCLCLPAAGRYHCRALWARHARLGHCNQQSCPQVRRRQSSPYLYAGSSI